MRRTMLWVLVIAVTACEFRSTNEWIPSIEDRNAHRTAEEQAARAAAAEFIWIVDVQLGLRVAVGVAAGEQRLWVPTVEPLPANVGFIRADGAAVAATVVTATPSYALLDVDPADAKLVPARRWETPVAGDEMERLQVGSHGLVREPITAIAVADEMVATTCPRAGAGLVFSRRDGSWLPAVWLPDPEGGCPILRRVALD